MTYSNLCSGYLFSKASRADIWFSFAALAFTAGVGFCSFTVLVVVVAAIALITVVLRTGAPTVLGAATIAAGPVVVVVPNSTTLPLGCC